MTIFNKPRFIGSHINSDSRYEHFVNYVKNYELGSDAAAIYVQSFNSQINNYLKMAAGSRNDLIGLEEKLSKINRKTNLTAAGLIAQEDARIYVLEALTYSREAVLSRVHING